MGEWMGFSTGAEEEKLWLNLRCGFGSVVAAYRKISESKSSQNSNSTIGFVFQDCLTV